MSGNAPGAPTTEAITAGAAVFSRELASFSGGADLEITTIAEPEFHQRIMSQETSANGLTENSLAIWRASGGHKPTEVRSKAENRPDLGANE